MDDIYIICQDREELKSIIAGISEQAAALGMFINEKKTHIARLSDTYKFLQIKYSLTNTGKVVTRINPTSVTRERRRMKAYKSLMDKGRMTYEDIEQAAKSWMGDYARLMSRKQIEHMKAHYRALFGKELSWKPGSHSRTDRK